MSRRFRQIPFLSLLICLLAILLLTSGGRIAPLDDETTYRTAGNLLEYGRLSITQQTITLEPQTFPGFVPRVQPREWPTTWAAPGRDGRLYPQFTPGQSLLEMPLYLLGRMFAGAPTTWQAVAATRFTISLFNALIIALTGWLMAWFGKALGFSNRLSTVLGLTYGLGTMAVAYTHTDYSEPTLTFGILLAAYVAYRTRDDRQHLLRWLVVAGTALGAATFIRERSAIMLPAFFLYVLLTQRKMRLSGWLALMLPIGVGGVIIGLENWLLYGSPTTFSFSTLQHTSFTTPILLGIYGLLFSPGKGLLIYNPIGWIGLLGLIGMLRRLPAEALLFGLTFIVEVAFFATYEFWTGGWNWGPRYIMPVLPLLLLAAGEWVHVQPSRVRQVVFTTLCLAGFVLNVPAALVDHSRYLVSFGERDPDQYLTRSTLQLDASPLVQQWPMLIEVAALSAQPQAWATARQEIETHLRSYTGPYDLESLSTRLLWVDEFMRLNLPDFWFVHLWLLGASLPILVLSVLALLLVAVASAVNLYQTLRPTA